MHLSLQILPPAVRTVVTDVSIDIHDYIHVYPTMHIVAIQVILDITDVSGASPGLNVRLRCLDPGSDTYVTIKTGATQTVAGTSGFVTGLSKGGSPGSLEGVVSQKFMIRATPSTADAITYSVGANIILSQ